jgi:excisionase family DNA binding protein
MTDVTVMLTPAQVAKRLNRSKDFVYDLIHNGEIGYHDFGRGYGIPGTEVDAYLERTFVPARAASSVVSIDEHRLRPVQTA